MQFFLSSDLRNNFYIRVLLLSFVLFCLSFLLLNPLWESERWGLKPQQIILSLCGDPEAYLPAKEWANIVNELHINLFLYPLLSLTVLSLFVHIPISLNTKLICIFLPGVGILSDALGVVATRYGSHFFVYLKIFGFWIFELSLLIMSFSVFIYLLLPPSRVRSGSPFTPPHPPHPHG